MSDKFVYYVVGEDPISRAKDLSSTIDEIVGNQDKSLCVETFDLADADSEELRIEKIEGAVNSLLSPPFLSPLRVVVIRDIGAALTGEVTSLVNYLDSPTPNVFLIAVQGGGRISVSLTKKWKPNVIQVGQARESIEDLFSRLSKEKKITFEPGVREEIFKNVGADSSKLAGLFDRLENIYGKQSKLSIDQIQDYMGESGNVAIYELANKITSGDQKASLEIVSRMLHSTSAQNTKPMHSLQIIALLANHFRKLALLDNPQIRTQDDAFAALGSKGNPYAAKKSWDLSRQTGSNVIVSCLKTLGAIEVMAKGANAIDAQISVELGIISLCQICSSRSESESRKIVDTFSLNLYV